MTIVIPSRPARPIRVDGGGRIPVGGTTGQALVKSSDNDYATEWGTATAAAAWGSVTGTLSAQTDLQSALDAKQATLVSGTNIKTLNGSTILGSGDLVISASAAWGGITGTLSSQTDLQSALDAKANTSSLAAVATSGSASDLGTGTLPIARIADGAVTLAKLANMATASVYYRKTAGSGVPEVQTLATLKTDLGLTGTNSGDQTITLTGMVTGSGTGSFAASLGSFTKAQLNTAVSDGDVLYVGDVTSNATHTGDATGATALTLATVNSNVGSFGSATQVATFTVNAKGLTTAAGNTTISIPMTAISDSTAAGRAVLGAATATAQTALFDVFTSGAKGLAPASGGGTTNFLRADGTWAAPPGGGGGSVAIQDEGVSITTTLATLNVVGLGARVTGTSAAVLTVNGLVTAAPATDQANWAPSGFDAGTGTIYMQPTTNSFLTGLSAGSAGQSVTLVNDSDFLICVERESGASTAANRFEESSFGSIWLMPQESILARYSATLSRWVVRNQSFDPRVIDGRSALFMPGTGAIPAVVGIGSTAVTATASHNSPTATPTDDFAEYGNIQVTNSTASGSASVRSALALFMRGASAGRQGFFHTGVVRFTALGATGAVRAGVVASTGAIAGLSAAQVNCLFIGADAGHTNLRIFSGNAAAGTPVDLGANFPTPSATAAYDYAFYAPPNSSFVRYMVRRLDTRFVAEGSLTANIPVNTAALGQRLEVAVGGTAAANTAQAAYLLTRGL